MKIKTLNKEIYKPKKMKTRKIELSVPSSIILIILFSFGITAISFMLQPNSLTEVIANINRNFLIFVLNFIPVLVILSVFYLLTNNVFYSAAFVLTIFEAASIINRYKIFYRDDPFVPMDFSIGTEALNVMTKMDMKIDPLFVILIFVSFAILFLSGLFVKSKKIHLLIRASFLTVFLAAAVLLNIYVYKPNTIYNKIHTIGPQYYVTGNFNTKGFVYCFLHSMNIYSMDTPAHYSRSYAEKLPSKYSGPIKNEPAVKPHIIMIMSEAFSDITNHDSMVFDVENDPLHNFKKLSEESLKGYIIVPNFGGGTANTEYDVLTGFMTQNLSKTPTSAFRLVRKEINSLPRFFTRNGYNTSFLHPGESWFYNRKNVYNYFGINEQIFIDSFKKPQDYKGSLVSDKAFTDKVITHFTNYLESNNGKPLFNYSVSIENHMPYRKGKFGNTKIQAVRTKMQLTPKASELLSNYVEGVRDADKELARLVDFFRQSGEPIILAFFGDHLPNLGENYLVYNELGYEINEKVSLEQMMNHNRVPFIIWANDEARKIMDFNNAVKKLELPESKTISANYFGVMLSELVGFSGSEPFYDFLNQMRKDIPIINNNYFGTKAGLKIDLSEEQQHKVNDYKIWQYYKMNGEKLLK